VSDTELQRLLDVGVRGARFKFRGNFKLALDLATFRRTLARVRELRWFAKMFGFGDDILAVEETFAALRARHDRSHGRARLPARVVAAVVRLILDLLAKENWWIGLSNGDLRSHTGAPWDDAVEFGRLFYQAAPARCVWGTDWPHVHRFIPRPGRALGLRRRA